MTSISINEGLKRVFEFHGKTCPKITIKSGSMFETVEKNGKDIPVFYYKYFNKFIGMKELKLLGSPCALTVSSIDTETIEKILFRELYVAEYLLGSEIEHITTYKNTNSANTIIGFKSNAKAHLQIHSAKVGERQFRHELFTTDGFVSDRVVDTVIAQHALNVYTEEGYESYTDADTLLYGLSTVEQEKVYAIYDIFEQNNLDELIENAKRLEKIVNLTLSNSKTYHLGEDF